MRNFFELHDRVEWSSQSQGCSKKKNGEVVLVVPKGKTLLETLPNNWIGINSPYNISILSIGYHRTRDHESYIIAVPAKSGKGNPKLYWPVVENLYLVGANK